MPAGPSPFAPFVCALVLFVPLAVLIVVQLRRGPKVKQACCRKCRYPVEGLTGSRCPECGSDLSKVGVLRPHQRPPLTPFGVAMQWTALACIPLLVLFLVLFAVLPRVHERTDVIHLEPRAETHFDVLVLRAHGKGYQLRPPFEDATIRIRNGSDSSEALEVRLDTLEYRSAALSQSEWSDEALTVRHLADWLDTVTSHDSDNGFEDEAEFVHSALEQRVELGGWPGHGSNAPFIRSGGSGHDSTRPGALTTFSALLLCLGVWIVGVVIVVRRARRRSGGRAGLELPDLAQS